ncbi:hypothetical protein Patl1_34452 [Pistacia atlantica]|uniref:Uncharacterized protein n=1 Tax=Pistacia atlantica TaxID=434234 RepID=A0ACC0ZR01_9ROSI|nr:hypothetical protein Patl1_34452 [Pistacia atlantica]
MKNVARTKKVYMLDSGARESIDLSNFTGYGDLNKKLAEIFNTEEELLASGIRFYIEALEKKPWDELCSVASKIIICQKQKEIVRNEDLSQESGESKEDFHSQSILNEEGRECEEDFDSQNRVNEEGYLMHIIVNTNDLLLVEESLDSIIYGTSCGGLASHHVELMAREIVDPRGLFTLHSKRLRCTVQIQEEM